jgi:hypothetical protein
MRLRVSTCRRARKARKRQPLEQSLARTQPSMHDPNDNTNPDGQQMSP